MCISVGTLAMGVAAIVATYVVLAVLFMRATKRAKGGPVWALEDNAISAAVKAQLKAR